MAEEDGNEQPKAQNMPKEAPQGKQLSLAVKDQRTLYAIYMPFLREGGLFIPTSKSFDCGEILELKIRLLEEQEPISVKSEVVWLTPPGAPNRAAGVGVQFQGKEGEALRIKIENYLGGLLNSENPTHTM